MTIRSHGRRHRSPLWARLTLALGIVLVVVTGSGFTAMRVVSHEINVSLPGVDLLNPPDTYVDEDVTSIHVGHTADGKQAVPFKTDAAGAHPRAVPGVTPSTRSARRWSSTRVASTSRTGPSA